MAIWALQLLLTAAVTVFILRRVGLGLDELSALDYGALRPRWGLLLLSCAVLLSGYVASALVWSRMVRDLGGPGLAPGAAIEVYLLANLGRYLPGKLWQIAGLAVLAVRRGVPGAVATAAALLGQALALGGATAVGALALASGDAPTGWSLLLLGAVAGMITVVLVPPLHERAVGLWFRLARHGELTPRPAARTTLAWLALYTANWIVYAAAFVLLVRSLGFGPPAPAAASAFAAAYVLGYAALFAPAGIGVREGFLVLFLSPLIGVAEAGVVSVVARLWTTGVELAPAAALWALHLGRAARREGEAQDVRDARDGERARPGTRPGRPGGLP
jgi:hypothetical protein